MGRDGPGPVPPGWLKCPRKSAGLVGGKFLAFKTPLSERFDEQVPPEFRFSPSMLFSSMKSYKQKIGLWIDLTKTDRFYNKSIVEENECTYVKLKCEGHQGAPTENQVKTFVHICQKFIAQHPLEIIAVHCTHGFNRTGFMIVCYLIETFDWSPEAAWSEYKEKRPVGIYKQEYIQEIFSRYGDAADAPSAPERPEWRNEDTEPDATDDGANSAPRSTNRQGKIPVFMEGVPGVYPITEQPLLDRIQRRFNELAHFRKRGFPGSQPVSMDRDNINFLRRNHYKVSWKADGTRYMMLIDGPNSIFFADRDHAIFKVEGMTFLSRKNENEHVTGTLLDGEMVIDEDPVSQQRIPRYLVYDIIAFRKDGQDVPISQNNFSMRLMCIEREIEGARNKYIQEGKINKEQEPFRIRLKKFWDVQSTRTLLGPKFTKKELGHEPDGIIFQPVNHPYIGGRDYEILKWKPSSHNSVDFKLRIERENRAGMIAKDIGKLYVGGLDHPYSEIKVNSVLRALNNKIIECKWDHDKNCWSFMRERTDKSFPNAFNTAQGVMKSIQFPVTEDILLNVVESVPPVMDRSPAPKRPVEMPPPTFTPPTPKFSKFS